MNYHVVGGNLMESDLGTKQSDVALESMKKKTTGALRIFIA